MKTYPERYLDWSVEAMDVPVVAGSLIRLVLLHQRNELFGCPPLGLEVVAAFVNRIPRV
jgi:hypothetical protein